MSEPLFRIPRRSFGNLFEVMREYAPETWGRDARSLAGVAPMVLDVGANVGVFSLVCSFVFVDCQIAAFEPHPETYKHLAANLHNVAQTTTYRCAVVGEDVPGTMADAAAGRLKARATLHDGAQNRLGASLYRLGWQSREKAFTVPLLSAKRLPPCDVFKCDVEGAELGIVRAYAYGARVRLALLEWHRAEEREPLEEVFRGWGLRRVGLVHGKEGCGVMRWAR
jgi:FkbM family methyltransferase